MFVFNVVWNTKEMSLDTQPHVLLNYLKMSNMQELRWIKWCRVQTVGWHLAGYKIRAGFLLTLLAIKETVKQMYLSEWSKSNIRINNSYYCNHSKHTVIQEWICGPLSFWASVELKKEKRHQMLTYGQITDGSTYEYIQISVSLCIHKPFQAITQSFW